MNHTGIERGRLGKTGEGRGILLRPSRNSPHALAGAGLTGV